MAISGDLLRQTFYHHHFGIMKKYIAFLIVTLLSGASILHAQETDNQTSQAQEGVQGWYQQNSGVTSDLLGVSFSSKDTGWIAGSTVVMHTTNGGVNWASAPSNTCSIAALGGKSAVIGDCSTEKLFYTNDGGQTWNPSKIDSAYSTVKIIGISFPNSEIGYTLADNFSILKTVDAGVNWSSHRLNLNTGGPLVPPTLYAVYYLDSDNGMVVGDAGEILRMYGTGYTIQKDSALFGNCIFGACQLVTKDIEFAVGGEKFDYPSVIVRTTNGGNTWDKQYPNGITSGGFSGIAFPDSLHGTVVGNAGIIFHTTDGGETWNKQESGVTTDLIGVSFSDSLNGAAVGASGVILHTLNGGYSWVNPSQQDSLSIQTYPNPANQSLTFQYSLPTTQTITLSIFDIVGRSMGVVLNNSFQNQGDYTIPLNTASFPNGTYYYRLESPQYYSTGQFSIIH